MRLEEFLSSHPVFTSEEFARFLRARGSLNESTHNSLLHHHLRQGRVVRVRRGLYATLPPGASPDTFSPDPFLVAAKFAPDAVLGYHTALEFHGRAYSVHTRYTFLTATAVRELTYRDVTFRPVLFAKALRVRRQERYAVNEVDRAGVSVRVTSLERTLVDVLDRPDLAGGWEEAWRSLESVEFFDHGVVVKYALLLDNATVAAKVGFYLQQHRESLMVEEEHLRPLRERRPKEPHYAQRAHAGTNRFLPEWNLVVPAEVADRSWEAVR
jgi:predicted transcriptional regulator of viral defense system